MEFRKLVDYNKFYIFEKGCWMHKTKLKLFLNPILRKLQFWTDTPFVIYSDTTFKNGKPYFNKYGFGKVKYFDKLKKD